MNRNRIARYIMLCASVIFMASSTGCGNDHIVNPKPAVRYYDGIVAYTGSVPLEVRVNPSCLNGEHSSYTNWVSLNPPSGGFSTAAYLFQARDYTIDFRDAATHDSIRSVIITPDTVQDDRTYQYLSELDWVYDYDTDVMAK